MSGGFFLRYDIPCWKCSRGRYISTRPGKAPQRWRCSIRARKETIAGGGGQSVGSGARIAEGCALKWFADSCSAGSPTRCSDPGRAWRQMWHVRYFGLFSQNEGKKRSSMMSGLSGFPVPMNTIAGDQLFRIARTSRVAWARTLGRLSMATRSSIPSVW